MRKTFQLGGFGRRIINPGAPGGGYSGKSRLLFGGADGSTTFTDDSGKTWTAFGNAQIDTSLGDQRGLFDGSGDYITTPDHTDFAFGSGDFSILFTMRFNSLAGFQTIVSKGYSPTVNGGWLIQTGNGDGRLNFYNNAGGVILSETTGTINTGQDYVIEVTRVSGAWTMKRDGVTVATNPSNTSDRTNTGVLAIGGGSSSGFNNFWFNGWIKSFEIP